MESTKPFPETLRSILELEDMSGRELTRRCEAHGWGSPATLSRLLRGIDRPSIKAIIQISEALDIPPETFAEYRLVEARNRLDPEEVGLKKALAELARIES